MLRSQKPEDFERLLFTLFCECQIQQANMIENIVKRESKNRFHIARSASQAFIASVKKEAPPEAIEGLEEMYDLIYMLNRRILSLDPEQFDIISEMVKNFDDENTTRAEKSISLPGLESTVR